MKTTYFKTEDGYAAVTDECPKGFQGIIYVGKRGKTPSDMQEAAITVEQLKGWEELVGSSLPPEWREEFCITETPVSITYHIPEYIPVVMVFMVIVIGVLLLEILLRPFN